MGLTCCDSSHLSSLRVLDLGIKTPSGSIMLVVLFTPLYISVYSTAHTGHNLGAEIPPQWPPMTWPRVTALLSSPGNTGYRERLSSFFLGTIIILTHGCS